MYQHLAKCIIINFSAISGMSRHLVSRNTYLEIEIYFSELGRAILFVSLEQSNFLLCVFFFFFFIHSIKNLQYILLTTLLT